MVQENVTPDIKPEHLSSSHGFVCVDWDLREEEQNKAVHKEARSVLTKRPQARIKSMD